MMGKMLLRHEPFLEVIWECVRCNWWLVLHTVYIRISKGSRPSLACFFFMPSLFSFVPCPFCAMREWDVDCVELVMIFARDPGALCLEM